MGGVRWGEEWGGEEAVGAGGRQKEVEEMKECEEVGWRGQRERRRWRWGNITCCLAAAAAA